MAPKKITLGDITNLTLDYYYSRPESVMAMISCAAAFDDADMLRGISEECKSRKIDVAALLKKDIERHEKLWGKLR